MKTLALAASAAATALLAFAPVAAADKPVTTEIHLDRTGTIAAGPNTCPFPINFHTEGTLSETVFSSGKDVTRAVSFHVTYTNPANGKSISSNTRTYCNGVLRWSTASRTSNRRCRTCTGTRPSIA